MQFVLCDLGGVISDRASLVAQVAFDDLNGSKWHQAPKWPPSLGFAFVASLFGQH